MIPQETAIPVNTTFWQAQYRRRYTGNWTATGPQFATEEKALAWHEREIAEPIRIPTELRIVLVTTTVTLTEIAKGSVPTK